MEDGTNRVGFIRDDNRHEFDSAIDKQNIQVIFVYRFQPPFGLVQLAYQKGTAEFGERGDQGHALFLKFAYVF